MSAGSGRTAAPLPQVRSSTGYPPPRPLSVPAPTPITPITPTRLRYEFGTVSERNATSPAQGPDMASTFRFTALDKGPYRCVCVCVRGGWQVFAVQTVCDPGNIGKHMVQSLTGIELLVVLPRLQHLLATCGHIWLYSVACLPTHIPNPPALPPPPGLSARAGCMCAPRIRAARLPRRAPRCGACRRRPPLTWRRRCRTSTCRRCLTRRTLRSSTRWGPQGVACHPCFHSPDAL